MGEPIYQITTYGTLKQCVQDLAAMVGFPKPEEPSASKDPAVQQMISAVNQAGADMLNIYDWQQMVKPFEIVIKADFAGQKEKSFDLPPDFWCFIDQTQWNKDTRLPAIGSVSPQQWQQIKIRLAAIVLTIMWQIRDNKLWVLSPPVEPQTLSFFYMSRGWVRDGKNPDLYKNIASEDADQILFDDYLVTLLARVKWLQMKGFDATASQQDFKLNYEIRKGKAKGAPILSLVKRAGFPYLNMATNVPDTGFGSR